MEHLSLSKRSKIISQLKYLVVTYDLDLYNITEIREYAYRESYAELYHIVSENPTKYFFEVLGMYE